MKVIETIGHSENPILYVLHGWGLHSGLLRPMATQLAEHFHVQLLDLPGHGHNQAEALPDTPEACAELAAELPRGHWLGWSLGGLLSLNLALQRPQQVERLVMLCATPCFVQRAHWPDGVDPVVLKDFGQRIQQDISATIERFLQLEVLGRGDERDQLKACKELAHSAPLPQLGSLQAGLRLLQQMDLTQALKNLQMPSLWVAGRRDRMVRPAAMQRASELCGGEFELIRGAGHAPFIHHAEDMTQRIQDFLWH